MSRRRKKKRSAGQISIFCIAAFLVVVISVQMFRLYQKNEALILEEESKQQELIEQQDRQEELEQEEQYIQSNEYKEEVAKDKLGLIYDNEIIFREN